MKDLVLDADHSWLETFKAERGHDHILSFSLGKDAIACWLLLRQHEINFVPYYLYLVPDLEFVEESIVYFEKLWGVQIVRLPHPSLFRMIDNAVFQPPERVAAQELAEEVSETLAAFRDRAKQEAKRFADATDSEYWVAVCFKTRDEKERFLRKFGLANLGDKYLDGRRVEEKLDKSRSG